MNASDQPDKFRRYRDRRKAKGLKEIRMWVPDVTTPAFKAEAKRQMDLLRNAPEEAEIMDFIEALAADDPSYLRGDAATSRRSPCPVTMEIATGGDHSVRCSDKDRQRFGGSIHHNPTLVRLRTPATSETGLIETSDVMIDKPIAVRRTRVGLVIGRLPGLLMAELDARLAVVVGLADPA